MARYAIVPLDENVDMNDSRLPSVMIWAGGEALDDLRADDTLDLDTCSLAVGIYRAMVAAAPLYIQPLGTPEAALFGALALLERNEPHYSDLPDRILISILRDLVMDRIRGRSDVEVALKAYRERVLEKIQDVRSAAAANFTPEFSGGKGEARCNSLYDAYCAVEGLEL